MTTPPFLGRAPLFCCKPWFIELGPDHPHPALQPHSSTPCSFCRSLLRMPLEVFRLPCQGQWKSLKVPAKRPVHRRWGSLSQLLGLPCAAKHWEARLHKGFSCPSLICTSLLVGVWMTLWTVCGVHVHLLLWLSPRRLLPHLWRGDLEASSCPQPLLTPFMCCVPFSDQTANVRCAGAQVDEVILIYQLLTQEGLGGHSYIKAIM